MQTEFCDLPACLPHVFKCIARRGIYAALLTCQHSGAKFNESVVRFMYALDVRAMSYARRNAFWFTAKIQAVVGFRALDGTI